MTYSYIPGDWEGWLMGSPEFETHVWLRDTLASSASWFRCAGGQGTFYYYDQNHPYWAGVVQLVLASEMLSIEQAGERLLI
jgi:hypothetical protein